jgi:hypothetical protein
VKNLFLISLIVVVLGVLAVPVLAQEPFESPVATATPVVVQPPTLENLPETAVEALEQVAAWLAALGAVFAGLAGRALVDVLKDHAKWLSEKNREKLGKGLTRMIAGTINTLVGVGVNTIIVYAIDLDKTGLWTAIVTLITVLGTPVAGEIFHRWGKARSPALSK